MAVRPPDADDAGGAAGHWLRVRPAGTTLGHRDRSGHLQRCRLAGSIATNVSEIVTAALAYAAGVATTTAATTAYITDLARRARYGAAHGVFGTIYDVGDALGPIVAGVLVAAVGYTRMFQVMAMVGLSMAVAFSLASRSRPVCDVPHNT